MTPAVRALESAHVAFELRQYEHVDGSTDYGREAAAALGIAAESVFKTLVVVADGEPAVAIVSVADQLSLKAAARALGAKRAAMCEPADAERITGYVVGGISPFGQRRRLPVVLDDSAEHLATIHVSAGRRGLEIAVAPADLVAHLSATVAPIASP